MEGRAGQGTLYTMYSHSQSIDVATLHCMIHPTSSAQYTHTNRPIVEEYIVSRVESNVVHKVIQSRAIMMTRSVAYAQSIYCIPSPPSGGGPILRKLKSKFQTINSHCCKHNKLLHATVLVVVPCRGQARRLGFPSPHKT